MMPKDPLLWGEGVAGTKALKTYGCLAKDRTLGTNIPLPSVLAWKFEAEPDPATHFSSLILCPSSAAIISS